MTTGESVPFGKQGAGNPHIVIRSALCLLAAVGLFGARADDWTGEPDEWQDYISGSYNGVNYLWFDTGIYAVPPLKVELDVMYYLNWDQAMCGARKYNGGDYCSFATFSLTGWKYGYKSLVTVPTDVIPAPTGNTRYHVVTELADGAQSITVDGATYTAAETGVPDTADTTLTLFANHHGTTRDTQAYGRVYGAKIWQNGTLVRDLRPCLKNGEACFYDTVTKTYIRNSTASTPGRFPVRTTIPAPDGVGDVAAFEAAVQSTTQLDEIILSKGTYTLTHTISNHVASTGKWHPVIIRGATGNRDDVILDGQNATRCLYLCGTPVYGVPTDYPRTTENTVRLADLTIRNGRQLDEPEPGFCRSQVAGGGALVYYGFVDNCAFVNCSAKSTASLSAYGGGLLAATLCVSNCLFDSCWVESSLASASGGGIGYLFGGSNYAFILGQCAFTNCSAWVTGKSGSGSCAYGGAFYGQNGHVYEGVRCFDCIATNTVGYDTYYHASGGAVSVGGQTSTPTVFRDACFSNCTVYGDAGAIYVNNSAPFVISNSTVIGCGGKRFAVLTTGAGTLENVLFEKNFGGAWITGQASVRSSVFRDNSYIEQGVGLYVQNACEISDCLFASNKTTQTKSSSGNGGALCCAASTLTSTVRVERCVFDGNACGCGPDGYYQYGGSALNLTTKATNVVIRNCHFLRNSNSPAVLLGNPTWDANARMQLENCSFRENDIGDVQSSLRNVVSTRSDSKWTSYLYLYLENCLFFDNDCDGIFQNSFYSSNPDHAQYCASDLSANFPADANGNILITKARKARNRGVNREWMTDATDGGDGTYTVTPCGTYGVKVTLGNVHARILGENVDIGAAEHKPLGIAVIIR